MTGGSESGTVVGGTVVGGTVVGGTAGSSTAGSSTAGSSTAGSSTVGSSTVVGIGVDAVDLHRFRDTLVRRPRMSSRLFTESERAYASRAVDPTARLATRFAAKEATMKALGVGLGAFAFVDVEVVRSGLDAPFLVLSGGAAELAARAGVVRWHLSLTHTDLVAMASVLAERDPTQPAGAPTGNPARAPTGDGA